MSFDFEPEIDLGLENENNEKTIAEAAKDTSSIDQNETSLVMTNVAGSQDVVTVNNLLGLTQSHINDDNDCRRVVNKLTEELNNSIQLMSIKDLIDYLKVKIKEREFHVDCIFKAYAFIQKSEFAREMLVGSTRKERIIEVSDRKRITGLLNMLNNTD